MYKNKIFISIVPALGGSKRLPRKNILDLERKPLIAWSIKSSLKSRHIDKVIVTSDENEILNISKNFGSDIIIRPNKLANDIATFFDTIKHAMENLKNYGYIILLQLTSSIRTEKHIGEPIKLLIKKKCILLLMYVRWVIANFGVILYLKRGI